MMELAPDLPTQLKDLRQARGLTQRQLAERLDTVQSSVAVWESWQYDNYTVRTLRVLAEALGARLVIRLEWED